MISEKQLAANRANAHSSTGPRTPEGKAKTRFNAVRHALTGQLTIVAPSEQAAFDGFSARLTADLKPSGEQELQIAARIVRDTWRLSRAGAHQDTMYAQGLIEQSRGDLLTEDGCQGPDAEQGVAFINAQTFFCNIRDFNLAGLYEQRIHRSLMKDYALFRQLQQDRKREETRAVTKTRPAVALKAAAANGSDFSISFAAPTGHPNELKIAPQPVNSDLPHPSALEKTPPQASTESSQAA